MNNLNTFSFFKVKFDIFMRFISHIFMCSPDKPCRCLYHCLPNDLWWNSNRFECVAFCWASECFDKENLFIKKATFFVFFVHMNSQCNLEIVWCSLSSYIFWDGYKTSCMPQVCTGAIYLKKSLNVFWCCWFVKLLGSRRHIVAIASFLRRD